MLQGQSINLIEAAKESKVVISVLREERNDQTVWSELFERAKELAAGCEIEPNVQGYLQSSVTEPTYLPLHHSSIGTEPSTCLLLIILFKSSVIGCSTTMIGSWVNNS